jgi:hypothetical protein
MKRLPDPFLVAHAALLLGQTAKLGEYVSPALIDEIERRCGHAACAFALRVRAELHAAAIGRNSR